jgi:hypothetical protein
MTGVGAATHVALALLVVNDVPAAIGLLPPYEGVFVVGDGCSGRDDRRGMPFELCSPVRCNGHAVQASITDPELLEELAFVKPHTKGVLTKVLGSHADNWNERGVVVQFW